MKIHNVLLGVALVLIVLGLVLQLSPKGVSLSGTTRDDIVLDVDTGRLTNGYALTVTGDEASFAGTVNSSGTRGVTLTMTGAITGGSLAVTGGTTITGLRCNSVEYDAPSLASNATTSVDVALTGATASQSSTQAFWGSLATSSNHLAIQSVHNTSTADTVNVLIKMNSSTAAIDLNPVRLNVCLIGF